MKKLLRSTYGTLAVAALLAVAPPMYARGGHGGHRSGHGGHGGKHAAVAHVKGGHGAFRVRGGHGNRFVGPARGSARYAGRGYYRNRGGRWGGWGGYYGYPYYGYSRYSLGYYGLGYGYPYYGSYGNRSGWCYDPYYGYWPSVGFSFGFSGY